MWPRLLDMSRDEAKRNLRRIELEAYSCIVSALRAQGELTKEKKKILSDLQHLLSISTERHRAEVRRAVNDEVLTTIADNMTGCSLSSEWLVEGRRLIPLMPRLVPQTAFTVAANAAAAIQAEKNASMPNPSATGVKEVVVSSISSAGTSTTAPVTKFTRPNSPTSNVVVLPSGMSIHIKGGLNTDEDEDLPSRTNKRKRSSSFEGPITVTRSSVGSSTTQSKVSTSNTIQGISPMKITLTKSPARTPSQKVILVSNSGTSSGPSILQRSLSVPVVKTTTAVAGSKTSIIVPSTMSSTSSASTSIVTTTASSSTAAMATASDLLAGKARLKTITARPRTPQGVGIVQVGAGSQNIQVHPVSGKQAIQIKQEGGMKIITKSIAGSSGKILPKPSGGPSVVVVTSGTTSVVSRALNSVQGGKVVNISTSGGKVITTTARNIPNVVTVNPKTLQLTAVKTSAGSITVSAPTKLTTASGTKANVIVVQQKTNTKKLSHSPIAARTTGAATSLFEKELVSFIQKHEQSKQATSTKIERIGGTKKTIITEKPQVKLEDVQSTGKSSLLAELIQAVGIGPESSPGSSSGRQSPAVVVGGQEGTSAKQKGHEWIECDEAPDASAIKALLEMQSSGGQQSTFPAQQTEVYTLEEAAQLLAGQSVPDNKPTSSDEGLALLEAMSKQLETPASVEVVSTPAPQIIATPTQPTTTTVQSTIQHTMDVDTFVPQSQTTANNPEIAKQPAVAVESSADPSLDIFSTALASAQIDLDPYQFIDDDLQEVVQPPKLTHVHQPHVPVGMEAAEKPAPRIIRLSGHGAETSEGVPSSSTETVAIGRLPQSFIPLQDVVAKSGSSQVGLIQQGQSSINVIQQLNMNPSNVSVRVEPSSGNIDISSMNFDDFTSQRLGETSAEYGEGLVGLDGSISGDLSDAAAHNLGKRKRKPPPAPDDNPAPSVVGGWIRAALGLLQRVARFRGANREKGEINAAAWFTRPVDPNEAPGYYQIITQPMDFGSIKRKLETSAYTDISEFHTDMCLVRDNCYKYNPPNSDVRLDCDEVFTFYMAEYDKLIDRLQKPVQQALSPASSPATKKAKVEKSPGTIRILPPS